MTGLLDRLTQQLGGDHDKALAILVDRGHANADGTLTWAGQQRDSLGAAGRAKDRASKASGRPASDYRYDPGTNRATLVRVRHR